MSQTRCIEPLEPGTGRPAADATYERLLSLEQAAAEFRARGYHCTPIAVWRWTKHGKLGVRLGKFKPGRQIMIPEFAIDQFIRALAVAETESSRIRVIRRRPACAPGEEPAPREPITILTGKECRRALREAGFQA